jgi:chaperonin cofactor prefoldin
MNSREYEIQFSELKETCNQWIDYANQLKSDLDKANAEIQHLKTEKPPAEDVASKHSDMLSQLIKSRARSQHLSEQNEILWHKIAEFNKERKQLQKDIEAMKAERAQEERRGSVIEAAEHEWQI